MKRKYEDESLLLVIVVFLVGLSVSVLLVFRTQYYKYRVLMGTFYNDNMIKIIVSDQELSLIHKNKYLYIKNHKQKFAQLAVSRNVLEKDKKNYHEVVIKTRLSNYKVNDYVKISILEKKENASKLLQKIWRE